MNMHAALRLTKRHRQRRGLAPLEFVLWLPVFLFVMALMVNFGTMAAWRVRGEIVSHDAALRTRWPRTAGNEAGPGSPIWPRPALMAVRSDRPIVQLDDPSVISQRIRSVVRGPLPNNFNVRPLLDPLQGNHKGVAEIQRRYPLLPRLGGLDTGEIANPLLDRKFTNAEMNFRNVYRRTRALYDMPWDQGQWARFEQTWQSIPQLGSFAGLRVLEYDDDWVKYSHDYRNWHYMAIPDFHPRVVSDRCTLDFAEIYRRKVEPLLDVKQPDGSRRLGQITLLPRTMTRAFLSMFDRTRREMEDELRMLQQNPPPGDPSVPAKIAFIQGELPIVKTKISQLERFQKRIPTFERQMASRR